MFLQDLAEGVPATFYFYTLVNSKLTLSDKLDWTFLKQIMNIIFF